MTKEAGKIGWIDYTSDNADKLIEFYSKVTGMKYEKVSMGDYDDYTILSKDDENGVFGICHNLGGNSDIPKGFIPYINVENIEKSVEQCKIEQGKQVTEIKVMKGYGKYCILTDINNIPFALFEKE